MGPVTPPVRIGELPTERCLCLIEVGPDGVELPLAAPRRLLGELTFIPKQVWLCLIEFIPRDVSLRWRADQRIWTTAVHWEGAIPARELSFAGQEQIIPMLRDYFDQFDYDAYRPSG